MIFEEVIDIINELSVLYRVISYLDSNSLKNRHGIQITFNVMYLPITDLWGLSQASGESL